MADGMVILGTVAIVGLVAVTTIAMVYNRSFGFRGTNDSVEVNTRKEVEASAESQPISGIEEHVKH